jgi:spectinomycin phosphotransferase
MREPPSIPEQRLRACLQDWYGLIPTTFDFLPLGLDYHAGVYRVRSEQGSDYLLKVTSRPLYEPACLVPRYLRDQGITEVVAPLPTKSNALWAQLEDWRVIVYPFIEGDTSWEGMTDAQWREVGSVFKHIHQAVLPSQVRLEEMKKETFDAAQYARWIRGFEAEHARAQDGEGTSECTLRDLWMAHQSTIHAGVTTLEKLAEVLQRRELPFGICHADLHPANLLRDAASHVFVIDWDEVMLAPRERDFIFISELQAEAFFQGYGQVEIDWTALTYYLWERVLQDVIACAQDVFSRDDLGEESKADIVQLFRNILESRSSTLTAAYTAMNHLPPDLAAHIGKRF